MGLKTRRTHDARNSPLIILAYDHANSLASIGANIPILKNASVGKPKAAATVTAASVRPAVLNSAYPASSGVCEWVMMSIRNACGEDT